MNFIKWKELPIKIHEAWKVAFDGPAGIPQEWSMKAEVVDSAWQVLQAARPALPRRDNLGVEIADADAAQKRGYYLPDEDERLRNVYCQYLAARASLWQMVRDLRPYLHSDDPRIFGLAICAASMLMRSASFVIELSKSRPVVWAKLDEAEPRYHLPRKSFTRIYSSLNSPAWVWRYQQARSFYQRDREQILSALEAGGLGAMIPWLEEEEPYLATPRRSLLGGIFTYRLYSLFRRSTSGYTKAMFHLFRLSGCAIAELKQPFVKKPGEGKRVTDEVRSQIRQHLKPGDFFVTRHDDAVSNLFLPGFWPHAALYLGDAEQREQLGIRKIEDPSICILEAKKDGVKFRRLEETLAVDAVVVLRPNLSDQNLQEALDRAITHEGKLYDFLFDFTKAERLACTEVIYRSYHGIGDWDLKLEKQNGRLALSAENLMKQALASQLVEVVLIYGVKEDLILHGDEALRELHASLGVVPKST